MPSRLSPGGVARPCRSRAILLVLVPGAVVLAVAGMAVAKSFTLKVTKNVHVTNTPTKAFRVQAVDTHEAVAVGPSGYPVYTFQGETTHHLICKKTSDPTTNCWAFWPPLSASSANGVSKQSGISGKLGTFRNHGTLQVTLNGQPLYNFTPDIQSGNRHQALGDELKTFGSIWHVVKASGGGGQVVSPTGQSPGSPAPPYQYPPS